MIDYENKFVLSNKKAPKLLTALKAKCPMDQSYPEAIVSSVYFDSKNLCLLNEKVNSDFLKTKYRIRWYSDINTGIPLGNPFLEVKAKTGGRRSKKRQMLDIKAQDFVKLPYECPEYNEYALQLKTMHRQHVGILRPHYIVSYKRVRFQVRNTQIRFCLDYDIHGKLANEMLTPFKNFNYINESVFEIKGEQEFLPEYMKILESYGGVKDSFSKYFACYKKLKSISLR